MNRQTFNTYRDDFIDMIKRFDSLHYDAYSRGQMTSTERREMVKLIDVLLASVLKYTDEETVYTSHWIYTD